MSDDEFFLLHDLGPEGTLDLPQVLLKFLRSLRYCPQLLLGFLQLRLEALRIFSRLKSLTSPVAKPAF